MPRFSSRSLAWLCGIGLLSCGGDADSDTSEDTKTVEESAPDAGPGAQPSDSGATAATSSSGAYAEPTDESASAAFDGSFEACVEALKPRCTYEETATACSSLMTPVIPLSNGDSWGDIELKGGPYGGFVAWNQGADFKNPVALGESTCDLIASAFGEPQSVTQDILDLRGQDLGLYTIFRPACMKDDETYPVITWGDGTCGQAGGYASLLVAVASHGFVIIAANSRFTDAGNQEMLRALDLAEALNADPDSLYHDKLDLEHIGAMGHSQGASATAHAAADPRIKAVILFNGGLSSADKPFLAVSGDRDITSYTPQMMADAIDGAQQPGAFLYYHNVLMTGGNVTGHLTLMEQPERVVEPTVAWWKYMLKDDDKAKQLFTGDDCGLCNRSEDFEFGAHDLP